MWFQDGNFKLKYKNRNIIMQLRNYNHKANHETKKNKLTERALRTARDQ